MNVKVIFQKSSPTLGELGEHHHNRAELSFHRNTPNGKDFLSVFQEEHVVLVIIFAILLA